MLLQLNTDVKPCEDFYQFACGNFSTVHPMQSEYWPDTSLSLRRRHVRKVLKSILASSTNISDQAEVEAKAKNFYRSCTDASAIYQAGGSRIEKNVIKKLGDLYLFDDKWNRVKAVCWDFNSALRTAYIDLDVPVFFSIYPNSTHKYVLEIITVSLHDHGC
jgi:predicted metalloendopeptidase